MPPEGAPRGALAAFRAGRGAASPSSIAAMEAASSRPKDLAGDKAQRIVDAMRASVARRGAAGSTFDHVAREAGVSRGLLHYYFGTKERLLVEVVRRDSDLRIAALDAALAGAHSAEDFIEALVRSLEDLLDHDPDVVSLWFELFNAARRNEEIAAEVAELSRRTRERVAAQLQAKHEEGVIALRDEPEAVASVIFCLGDGLSMRLLLEPDRDARATLRAAMSAGRALLT